MVRKFIVTALILLTVSGVLFSDTAERFNSEGLYESALANNLELQKMTVENRQAEIDLKNAEAARLPKIDFQSTLTWMSQPVIEPITLTAGELGIYDVGGSSILLPSEDMKIYGGTENTHYDFKFIIDQPVYTWGKISNAIKLYNTVLDTSSLNMELKRKEIKTALNIYFYSIYYIRLIEESLNQQAVDSERLIILAEESYKNGFILYTDLLEAKIKAKEITIAEIELNEQKEEAFLALSRLTGIKGLKEENLDFSGVNKLEEIRIETEDYYIQKAMTISPEIQMLKRLQSINEYRLDISSGSAAYKPDIGLHLELGYSGPRFPFIEIDWFGQDSLSLTTTLALQTTVFEGGKQKLQIQRSLEELEKSFFEYELGIEALRNIIYESILKLELNKQNIDYFRLLQENDEQQIQLKQTQIQAGSGSETELLTANINLDLNRINEYRESIKFFRNYFTLIAASSTD